MASVPQPEDGGTPSYFEPNNREIMYFSPASSCFTAEGSGDDKNFF